MLLTIVCIAQERKSLVIYVNNAYSKTGFFAKALGLEPRRVGAGVRNRSDKDILLSSQNVNYSSFYRHIGLRETSINTALSLTVELNF